MLWFVAAFAGSIVIGRYVQDHVWENKKWSWFSFGMSLLSFSLVALLANVVTMAVMPGRDELAATHSLDEIKDGRYLAVGESEEGSDLRFRVQGELDSRVAINYKIIKSAVPYVEIFNNRPSSFWYTIFGDDQQMKIYVPNSEITTNN